MKKELNCMNCCIGDFKQELCDCNNGFCKEFKSIGKQEDFFNAVMQRIRPQGEWILKSEGPGLVRECSICGAKWHHWIDVSSPNYCGRCGAKMKAR